MKECLTDQDKYNKLSKFEKKFQIWKDRKFITRKNRLSNIYMILWEDTKTHQTAEKNAFCLFIVSSPKKKNPFCAQ